MEPQPQQMKQPTQSASLKEFATAMCELQKNNLFANPSTMNYYKRGFADLPEVWKTIRKPLTSNGFSVIQTNAPIEGGIAITTLLLHKSGEWIRGTLEMPAEKSGPQAYGSAMTYARRYALMAIVGVSTADEDDDAESATDRSDTKSLAQKVPEVNIDTSKIHEMPSGKGMLPIEFPDDLADYPIEAQYPIIVKPIDDAKTHWDVNGSDVFADGNGYYFSTAPGFTNPPKCVHVSVVDAILRFGTDAVIKKYPNIKMFGGDK